MDSAGRAPILERSRAQFSSCQKRTAAVRAKPGADVEFQLRLRYEF
jgi:hypothetical protein